MTNLWPHWNLSNYRYHAQYKLHCSNRVLDPHQFSADPESSIHFETDGSRILLFTLMRIRILLLIKVMRACDHWSTDPLRLHFHSLRLHTRIQSPPLLHFELWLLNFNFNVDPGPASQNNAGYGSATLSWMPDTTADRSQIL
jgi:hypothetical protein